jgi:hypothetical protein
MRAPHPIVRIVLAVALLIGPTVLAFYSGGFFDEPRLVALIVAWAIVALAVIAGAPPLPQSRLGLVALGGVAGYVAWITVSGSWSPLPTDAADDAQRALLYLGAFVAAVALLRSRVLARAGELVLAAGAVTVVGYALAGRLLPGIVHEAVSADALGRLDQPLTYWNAMGALAAIAFTLSTRIAGDRSRPRGVRVAAGAAAVPMLVAVYLTFSRGALAAVVAGLVVLTVMAPTWGQLRISAITLELGVLGIFAAAASAPVRTGVDALSSREGGGALVFVVLVALMAGAAALVAWSIAGERSGAGRSGRLPLPSWAGLAAGLIVVAIVVVPVAVARDSKSPAPVAGRTSQRLTSVGSNRYAYWKVALRAGLHHPLAGVGASGFASQWLAHRSISEAAHDAHSLEIETFAELGLIGLALLGTMFAGIGLCGRAVQRADPALAAGPGAALTVWALHSAIDWDWEMPALTLIGVILAGLLVAQHEAISASSSVAAPSGVAEAPPAG